MKKCHSELKNAVTETDSGGNEFGSLPVEGTSTEVETEKENSEAEETREERLFRNERVLRACDRSIQNYIRVTGAPEGEERPRGRK